MFIKPDGDIHEEIKMYPKSNGVLAVIVFVLGIMVCILGVITAPEGSVFFFAGIILSFIAYLFFLKIFVVHEFCMDGIWVKYPFKKEKLIYWEEFQQICIYPTYVKTGTYIEIVCVKQGEKPKKYNPWRTQNLFKMYNIVTMDYTEEILERLKKYYFKEIVDYRKSLCYKKC